MLLFGMKNCRICLLSIGLKWSKAEVTWKIIGYTRTNPLSRSEHRYDLLYWIKGWRDKTYSFLCPFGKALKNKLGVYELKSKY